MTDDETRRNWILAPDDVQVGSTDRSQRYANDCLTRASTRFVDLFDPNFVLTSKNICFHFNTSLLLLLMNARLPNIFSEHVWPNSKNVPALQLPAYLTKDLCGDKSSRF